MFSGSIDICGNKGDKDGKHLAKRTPTRNAPKRARSMERAELPRDKATVLRMWNPNWKVRR